MTNIFKLPMVQRKAICGIIGIAFGFLFAYLYSIRPELQNYPNFWGSALMWSILVNRLMIGIVIFIAGVFTVIPLFNWRFAPWFRGLMLGAFVSLDLALWPLTINLDNAWSIFWFTIGAGAFYGLIIDIVATKITGEGKDLLRTS